MFLEKNNADNRSAEECSLRYDFLKKKNLNKDNKSSYEKFVETNKHKNQMDIHLETNYDRINESSTTKTIINPSTIPSVSNNNEINENDWSAEQQKQLEDGLRTYPNTMDKNERWTKIAKGVSGKTKKQCIERYKKLQMKIKNKKS